jgi:hypothetical protein
MCSILNSSVHLDKLEILWLHQLPDRYMTPISPIKSRICRMANGRVINQSLYGSLGQRGLAAGAGGLWHAPQTFAEALAVRRIVRRDMGKANRGLSGVRRS